MQEAFAIILFFFLVGVAALAIWYGFKRVKRVPDEDPAPAPVAAQPPQDSDRKTGLD